MLVTLTKPRWRGVQPFASLPPNSAGNYTPDTAKAHVYLLPEIVHGKVIGTIAVSKQCDTAIPSGQGVDYDNTRNLDSYNADEPASLRLIAVGLQEVGRPTKRSWVGQHS